MPTSRLDTSLVKPPKTLLFLAGSFWIQACDDGAGKPDSSTGAGSSSCETLRYRDADGDGFGNPVEASKVCKDETGWVDNNDDCNDENNYYIDNEVCFHLLATNGVI